MISRRQCRNASIIDDVHILPTRTINYGSQMLVFCEIVFEFSLKGNHHHLYEDMYIVSQTFGGQYF